MPAGMAKVRVAYKEHGRKEMKQGGLGLIEEEREGSKEGKRE